MVKELCGISIFICDRSRTTGGKLQTRKFFVRRTISLLFLVTIFIVNISNSLARTTTILEKLLPKRKSDSSETKIRPQKLVDIKMTSTTTKQQHDDDEILIVFSDLDGTLIHYPTNIPTSEPSNLILKLPPSSTGMRGIVSSKTLALTQQIRQRGVFFVLVSGMRTSTLLSRLPYLPRADAYCTEAGGRIFYRTDDLSSKDMFVINPENYDGASSDELQPFGLVEDMEWRSELEAQAGKYHSPTLKELSSRPDKVPSVDEREGLLWDFAKHLVSKGYVLDTKGYSACFRVNRKQQNPDMTDEKFNALLDGTVAPFSGLATSVNLACVDYYPAKSGKKNWYVNALAPSSV